MKLLNLTGVDGTRYIFRHWLKWYIMTDEGQILKINKVLKDAPEIILENDNE